MYHTARVPLPKQQQHGGVRYPLPPQFDPQVLEKSLGLSHFHLGCRYFDFGLIGFFSFVSTGAVPCSTVATSLLWLCLGLDLGSAGHLAAESQTVNRRVCSFVPGGHANCSNAQCGPSISFISHSAVTRRGSVEALRILQQDFVLFFEFPRRQDVLCCVCQFSW